MMHKKNISWLYKVIGTTLVLQAPLAGAAEPGVLELYVDTSTQQIFAEPGAGRVKLGNFRLVEDSAPVPVETVQQDDSGSATVSRRGLEAESAAGDFTMRLGGRIQADYTRHDDDNLISRSSGAPLGATSGTDIRRGRIALQGTAFEDFGYKLEVDVAGNSASVKDMFIQYQGLDQMDITVGNIKHTMGMEMEESTNEIMFNERSLLNALVASQFDRAIGINLKSSGDDWSVQGGLYGEGVSSGGSGVEEGHGWAVRATYAPINTGDHLIHLGANYGVRSNDENNLSSNRQTRFRYETTAMSDLFLSDTGGINDVEGVSLGILELSGMAGPWSVQSEFGKATIDREFGGDAHFDAFYVQMGWSLTGESRSYRGSDGEFKGLRPAADFSLNNHTWGAWELALRYDELDLEDSNIQGGEQNRISLNLNWYLNQSFRLMMGYNRTLEAENGPVTTTSGAYPDDVGVFVMRSQWAF